MKGNPLRVCGCSRLFYALPLGNIAKLLWCPRLLFHSLQTLHSLVRESHCRLTLLPNTNFPTVHVKCICTPIATFATACSSPASTHNKVSPIPADPDLIAPVLSPKLRDYQRECIVHSLQAIGRGVRRQAVSLPVGAGKTVIFSHLIPHLPQHCPKAKKVLVLAHRVELLQQAQGRIRDANPDLHVRILNKATLEEEEAYLDKTKSQTEEIPSQGATNNDFSTRNGLDEVAIVASLGDPTVSPLQHSSPASSSMASSSQTLHSTVCDFGRNQELVTSSASPLNELPSTCSSINKVPPPARRPVDVWIASVALLGRKNNTLLASLNPDEFKAIIVDEAHHTSANSYMRILSHFGAQEKHTRVLLWGCSATLRRHDGVALGAAFDEVTFTRTLQSMWDTGQLCQPRSIGLRTNVDVSSIHMTYNDFVVDELARVINTPGRNKLVVEAWERQALKSCILRLSTLVFCTNVQHAADMTLAFREAGHDARMVHGGTNADERDDIVAAFRQREFPILVNCNVFTEGTDIPCIDCVLVARPTCSAVLYQQMIGRGLRLFPGKQDCLIIDVVDNIGRVSIVTAPTLLGLAYDYDCNGKFFRLSSDAS